MKQRGSKSSCSGILTNIDAVASHETFRRLLRRHVAWEEEMTFHIRRDGEKLQVRISRGE